MKQIVTNEAGEPIGYEEHQPDWESDYYETMDDGPLIEDCYYCGKTFDAEDLEEISKKPCCYKCAGEIHGAI